MDQFVKTMELAEYFILGCFRDLIFIELNM